MDAALERIIDHLESLPEQPAADTTGGAALARSLQESLPRTGRSFEDALEILFDRAVPCSFNAAHPGYLAYIPGGGLLHAAVADLISDTVNRYMGVFAAAPGLSQIEANAVAWLGEIVGYPAASRGIFTSGGSLANWTALVTARRERLPEDFSRGVIYASDQTHHAVARAAMLAGFPPRRVRKLPADPRFRLEPSAVAAAVEEDRRAGLTPFLVAANAGTTNTGAVDPLEALGELARREELWLHVDAAYGGFFAMTERGRATLAGLERADSIVLDPHKGLFLPYGTGALLVRDGGALRRAHALGAEYLPPTPEDGDLVDFHAYSPELSRPFRGLRVWLPLVLHGVGAFRRALDEKLDLAQRAAEGVAALPEVDLLAPPELSLFPFRWRPPGRSREETDDLNRAWLEAVNRRQRVHLTGTVLPDGFALRICVLSFRTHRPQIDTALEDLEAAQREVRRQHLDPAGAGAGGR